MVDTDGHHDHLGDTEEEGKAGADDRTMPRGEEIVSCALPKYIQRAAVSALLHMALAGILPTTETADGVCEDADADVDDRSILVRKLLQRWFEVSNTADAVWDAKAKAPKNATLQNDPQFKFCNGMPWVSRWRYPDDFKSLVAHTGNVNSPTRAGSSAPPVNV